MKRIVLVLDMTQEEAADIARRLAGSPLEFKGLDVAAALTEAALLDTEDAAGRHITIRSRASAQLKGKQVELTFVDGPAQQDEADDADD